VYGVSVQGEWAFSASHDKTVKAWRWTTGELLTNFTQHSNTVYGVSVQGELAFSASDDRTVKVWRWTTGELLTNFTQHTRSVTTVSVQGELAFSASDDRTVKVWRWKSGEVIATFTADAPLTCLAFESQHRILLVGDQIGHVHVLRVVGLDHLLFPEGE
jgi:WD40 repeat protein